MNNVPVVFNPIKYVSDLVVSVASNTTLSVTSGACRDHTNTFDIVFDTATTVNAAVNGLNGLDTGTFAASSTYYLHAVYDQSLYNPAGFVLSLSVTAPYLPGGYNAYQRIGLAITDGSIHFLKNTQTGSGSVRQYEWDAPISVLSGGVATTQTAVSLVGAMGAGSNSQVDLQVIYTPATAANAATFYPHGSSGSGNRLITGDVAAKAQDEIVSNVTVILDSTTGLPAIDYKVANSSDALSLSVVAFKDFL